MRSTITCAAAVAALLVAHPRAQQPDFSQVQIKTTKIAGNFYTLEGQGGTIGVLAGPDGVFMVDAQFAPLTRQDRRGDQADFGWPHPVARQHPRARRSHRRQREHREDRRDDLRAREPSQAADHASARRQRPPPPPAPAAALPVVTYDAMITFHMNGEDVQLIPVPVGAHRRRHDGVLPECRT